MSFFIAECIEMRLGKVPRIKNILQIRTCDINDIKKGNSLWQTKVIRSVFLWKNLSQPVLVGSEKEKEGVMMLQVKKLNIIHRKDLRTITEDFNLVLNPGDKAVMIGEEGNGKSTILKWIFDPAYIEDYAQAEGERICTGEKLGYLPQELADEDKEKSVYGYICEEAMFWDKTPKELRQLANTLQLEEDIFYSMQQMGTLSGGERIKIQMARILIGSPTVLLLDEPSNDIDLPTLEWLEKFINEISRAVLFISHDETLIENTANMIIHIEQIRRKTVSRYFIAHTNYQDYIAKREEMMEKQRQEALNDIRQEKIRQEKLRRICQKVEHEQETISRQDPHGGRLLKKKMKAVKSLERRYEREGENMTRMPASEEAIFVKFDDRIGVPAGKVVLDYSIEELTTGSEDKRVLARNLSLFVKGGEKVCIVGKNGVGKSTLLRLIGKELLERKDIKAAYMPQNYEEMLDLSQTPVEYLAQIGDKEELTRIRTYLGSMKYTADEMSHPMSELSGGQKAKILLLKMSMAGAEVLILDEPTRNFSPLSNPVIRKVLADYGGAIISVSHDRKYIKEVCSVCYELTGQGLQRIYL